MRLEKCWFCSSTIYPGHGITFVRNDATCFKFCRSKCHKNFKMKRNPRKVRWTKAYRKLAGKELAEDATFEMERRRNRPEKYDRELVKKTVKAIERIGEIRQRRQERYYEKRMAKVKGQQVAADKQQLEKEIHLVKAPAALTAGSKDKKKEKLKVAVEQQQQQQEVDAMQE
jgi:large subunit ribosomal protein L24e